MDTKEAFYELFTANPVNWIKWGAVFLILILGYIPAVYLYKKIHYLQLTPAVSDLPESLHYRSYLH